MIGFVQGDHAVLGGVGRAPQSRYQVMSKERPFDPVGFLGGLGFRTGGEEGVALHVRRRVHHEGRFLHAALGADENAGGAGIDDRDAHVRGDSGDERTQLLVAQTLLADQESLLVRVAGIIEDEFLPPVEILLVEQALFHGGKRPGDVPEGGIQEQQAVGGGEAPHVLHDRSEGLGVGGRELKRGAGRAALVDADDDAVSLKRGRFPRGERRRAKRQDKQDHRFQQHRLHHYRGSFKSSNAV